MAIINDESIEKLYKQQQELEQSLQYASYIQQSLFPKNSLIKHIFPESFLFFKPKDIVSGDFYWINRESEKTIVAIGDSTGHGVPGAFLSILGISFLQLVISRYNPKSPAIVLNYLREYLMKALNQTGKEFEQKDGFDISLCFIDNKSKNIQFSGAFNPIYIIRDREVNQLLGDKMPIGIGADFEEPFTNHEFKLKKGDMIYLFTDGYPDQFGGPEGKKYKYKPFRKLLTECSILRTEEQEKKIKEEFDRWKGDSPQIDDVTIFGIRQ
ncbi:MAG: SpoIIE family protein phosphatase [Bacteroidales bacterium]|nr:SpoIIE family protein phosphatase [Bacteroidales bacterium]MBN2820197.1 SpoIIE family protein phosphatase [Bacteroidales bacterium]